MSLVSCEGNNVYGASDFERNYGKRDSELGIM